MELDPAVEELRRYFAGRLPERLAELEAARAAARDAGWTAEPLRHFHRLAHSLVGSGTTFGYPEVTEQARPLERLLKRCLEDREGMEDERVEEMLERLREVAGPQHRSEE
jgi:HPt (histidine-containing phosphotransfer) domain-containing protein